MWVWKVVALLGGLVTLGFGIHEAMTQHRLLREGIRVRGLVVRHRVDHSHDDPVYFAVVEFVDARGIRHTFQSSTSGVKGLPVGGEVPVRYLPDAPQRARIDHSRIRTWQVLFPLAGGTVITAIMSWVLATGP
ncbi:DUF3592 domain-containing protein [Actinosynnema sp. NPDC051121]